MSDLLHHKSKRQFQLERLILFSDAVFAIAITLLIIEIKVPEIEREHLSNHALLSELAKLIPKFFGFIISFMFIGIYWSVHHRMFGYVTDYSRKLVTLNLLFLFAIVLMPFSTAFYSEYVMKKVMVPVVFYTGNIVLLGLFNMLMWLYISKPENKLSEGLTRAESRYNILRSAIVPGFFVIYAFIYLYYPSIAVYLPITLFPIMRTITARHNKKQAIQNN